MVFEELSAVNEIVEDPKREAELRTAARGLSRTVIKGRREDGLPITEEGEMVRELMRLNQLRAEKEER